MGSPHLPSKEGKKSVGLLLGERQKYGLVVVVCMVKADCVL